MTPAAFILALAIGTGMGLLGGGGSIVAVPALTLVFDFAPKEAVLSSLVIVGLAAAAGAAGALARGVLPLRVALIVGLPAIGGAAIGGAIGARLDDRVQLLMLAATMLAAAMVMLRPQPERAGAAHRPSLVLSATGLGVGTLTGMIGVGGGFLLVPALIALAALPMTKASAVSLFVIVLSAASAIPHYAGRTALSWSFIAPFAGVAAAGAIGGGVVASRLPHQLLQRVFAAMLVIVGSYLLLKA